MLPEVLWQCKFGSTVKVEAQRSRPAGLVGCKRSLRGQEAEDCRLSSIGTARRDEASKKGLMRGHSRGDSSFSKHAGCNAWPIRIEGVSVVCAREGAYDEDVAEDGRLILVRVAVNHEIQKQQAWKFLLKDHACEFAIAMIIDCFGNAA